MLPMNKPADMECSHTPTHHPSVFSLLPPYLIARGVQCVGRLDADTTGLLLLSDDGTFIQKMTSPKHKVPKRYLVTCSEPVTDAQVMLELIAALEPGTTARFELKREGRVVAFAGDPAEAGLAALYEGWAS